MHTVSCGTKEHVYNSIGYDISEEPLFCFYFITRVQNNFFQKLIIIPKPGRYALITEE